MWSSARVGIHYWTSSVWTPRHTLAYSRQPQIHCWVARHLPLDQAVQETKIQELLVVPVSQCWLGSTTTWFDNKTLLLNQVQFARCQARCCRPTTGIVQCESLSARCSGFLYPLLPRIPQTIPLGPCGGPKLTIGPWYAPKTIPLCYPGFPNTSLWGREGGQN